MGSLASQAEIGVWVQVPEALPWGSGVSHREKKFWNCICKILQFSASLAGKCCWHFDLWSTWDGRKSVSGQLGQFGQSTAPAA